MKVYLLQCSYGTYEDYSSWISDVYATRELAQKAKDKIMDSMSMDNLKISEETIEKIEAYLCEMDYPFDEESAIKEKFPDVDFNEYQKYWKIRLDIDDFHEPEIIEKTVISE